MALISKLKQLIGLDRSGPSGGTTVTVEREPDTATERAVKESPPAAEESPEPAQPAEEPPEPSSAAEEPAASGAGSDDPVDSLSGIGSAYADRLADAGVETVADLAAADAAALDEATGIGEGRLEGWIEQAKDR